MIQYTVLVMTKSQTYPIPTLKYPGHSDKPAMGVTYVLEQAVNSVYHQSNLITGCTSEIVVVGIQDMDTVPHQPQTLLDQELVK